MICKSCFSCLRSCFPSCLPAGLGCCVALSPSLSSRSSSTRKAKTKTKIKILCAISATVWGRFLVVFFIWQPDKELWNAKERSLSKVKPNGLQRPPTRGLKKGHGFFITWFLMGCFVSHQISKPPRGVWVQQWAAPYAMSYIMGILIEAAGLVWEFVQIPLLKACVPCYSLFQEYFGGPEVMASN